MPNGKRPERMDSLLHPAYGWAAQDIRSAVDAAPRARLARLEALVEAARRHSALHHKHARGASVGELRKPVTFDANGHLQMRSLKPTVLIVDGDPTENPHSVVWDLDIDVLRPLLDIPEAAEPCQCCPEDITWQVVLNPGHPITVVFNATTCTWTLNLPCDPCGGGIGGT